MSSSDEKNSSKPTTNGASLDADLDHLTKLLNQSMSGDGNADASLQELLSCLQSADSIADGVETRVDSIINHLDGLLEGLEKDTTSQQNKDGVKGR